MAAQGDQDSRLGALDHHLTVTADLLAHHVERFSASGPDGLVFTNKAGNPLIASSFWQHYFPPALRRTGVSCRFHDLRRRTADGGADTPG